MNNFQIQKVVFICFTFIGILIPPGDAFASNLEKILTNKQKNRFNPENNFIDSKIYRDQFLTNLENNNYVNNPTKKTDRYIKNADNELVIESNVQSEKDNILYANGDVVVKF